jgi:N-acetylglucosaminyldiphosphoundecaprenol N-acetyl-beta-D-mannosaminyltransferase
VDSAALLSDLPAPLAQPARIARLRGASGPSTIQFIDVAFTDRSAASVIDAISTRPPASPFVYVVTPNVDHVVRLQRSRSDLWPAYRGAWMTLCDSRILARLARQAGCSLPVVPGSDLTAEMFEHVIEPSDSIAILGGGAALVAQLAQRYGLRDVRHYNPPMGFIHDPVAVARAVRFLIEARARYNFLAVGSPQQEIVAYRVARTGNATGIGFCIGASLDFLSGDQDRAPVLMQRMSLEWLFRLASNPRRMWRRYLVEGPEIFQIASSWRRSQESA